MLNPCLPYSNKKPNMGRINLIKFDKLLYIFWHSPVYLPLKILKTINSILKTFAWGTTGRHKLPWLMLKNPITLGGAALPDIILYYIAAQLSHYHLDKTDLKRGTKLWSVANIYTQPTHLCNLFSGVYEALAPSLLDLASYSISVFGNWPWLGLVAPHFIPILPYGLTIVYLNCFLYKILSFRHPMGLFIYTSFQYHRA